MSDAMVDQVRRFNRIVTERVGALNDRFLGAGGRWARPGCCGRSASTAAKSACCARGWALTRGI